MLIRFADLKDFGLIAARDNWISFDILKAKLSRGEVLVAFEDNLFAGWLRYGLFWDSIPFVNMLRVEEDMRRRGYKTVMTSSAQNEYAQHFYLKLGYKAAGGFTPENEPYELLFAKKL